MRILFAGTPDFSVNALAALHAAGHEICAVYTQPDRPAGRGRKLQPPPVKAWALEHGLEVRQPKSLKSEQVQQELGAFTAELMVVVAYGLLLPQAVLDAPRHGCFNIHASLLPRWRGAAPIQRAIEARDAETGVTIMQMDAGLDTGDMLLVERCPIAPETTAQSLHDTLSVMGARLIVAAVEALDAGELVPQKQPEEGVEYAHKLSKTEAIIDWSLPADAIVAKVNAYNPWPVAQTSFRSDALRIWRASVVPGQGEPGAVVGADKSGLRIAAGTGLVQLDEIQLPGKKAMPVAAFLNANDIAVGERLGANS